MPYTRAHEEGTVVSVNARPSWADQNSSSIVGFYRRHPFIFTALAIITEIWHDCDWTMACRPRTPISSYPRLNQAPLVFGPLFSIIHLLISGFPRKDLIPHHLVTFDPHPIFSLSTPPLHYDDGHENFNMTEEAQFPLDWMCCSPPFFSFS